MTKIHTAISILSGQVTTESLITAAAQPISAVNLEPLLERIGEHAYLIGFGTHGGTVAAADSWGSRCG